MDPRHGYILILQYLKMKYYILGMLILSATVFNSRAKATTTKLAMFGKMDQGIKQDSSTIYYDRSWKLYKDKQYENALKDINSAIELNPDVSAYYEVKCYILIPLKRNKELIETATKGIAVDPNNASFYDIRGNTYYFEFNPKAAVQDYEKMLEIDQTNARFYNNYLKVLNEQRQDSDIIRVYALFEQALKDHEQLKDANFIGDVHFYAALAYERMKDYDSASAIYTKAIKENDDASMYYNNRGLIYNSRGEIQLGLEDLSKAIALEPGKAGYYANRATIWMHNKSYDEARKDLLKTLSLGESSLAVYTNLATTYMALKDYTSACKAFENALKISPNNSTAQSNYAYCLYDTGQYDKAALAMQRAYQIDPKEIDILVGMLVCHAKANQWKEARKVRLDIKNKSTYNPSQLLLQQLIKEGYSYSDAFQSDWVQAIDKLSR